MKRRSTILKLAELRKSPFSASLEDQVSLLPLQELGFISDREAGHLQPPDGDAGRDPRHGHGLRAHGVPLQVRV